MKRKVFAAAVALLAAGSVWAQTEQNGDFQHIVEEKLDAGPETAGQVQPQSLQSPADGGVEPFHAQHLVL